VNLSPTLPEHLKVKSLCFHGAEAGEKTTITTTIDSSRVEQQRNLRYKCFVLAPVNPVLTLIMFF
jgi:predicted peptidase